MMPIDQRRRIGCSVQWLATIVRHVTSEVRFAVDRMLGRLATWLRLIGEDASWGAHLSGQALLRHASTQRRIVLTRDRHLLRCQSGPRVVLITSDHVREQLRQVVELFALDPFAHIFSRCVRCNQPVETIAKTDVRDLVPSYVFATQARFARCPQCRRIYWPATHHDHVHRELEVLTARRAPA